MVAAIVEEGSKSRYQSETGEYRPVSGLCYGLCSGYRPPLRYPIFPIRTYRSVFRTMREWSDYLVVLTVALVVRLLLVVGVRASKKGIVKIENANEMMKREGIGTRPFLFDLNELVAATDNFSAPNLLGR
ncbi:hypothetical protein HYC85_002676 [Camellia sinensis]|uniref:Uncharacterized protein n=1 Tax=Camellia sinensis TaxID=4442 RepID=A0A7J7IA73_CAMSI|nr:hypothetical protein HYC85_002676 [Camellia sinensis]